MKKDFRKSVQRVANVVAAPLVSLYLKTFYDGGELSGARNIPAGGPCLFSLKHDRKEDPLFFGLLQRMERPDILPSYLMRDLYLPWILREPLVLGLGFVGARRIFKTKDIRSGSREKRRRTLAKSKSAISGKNSILNVELDRKGYLVFSPEGKRTPGKMGDLQHRFFNMAAEYELQSGVKVSHVPVGLEYCASGESGREKVHIRIGEPRFYEERKGVEELVRNCREDIRKLSGLA